MISTWLLRKGLISFIALFIVLPIEQLGFWAVAPSELSYLAPRLLFFFGQFMVF